MNIFEISSKILGKSGYKKIVERIRGINLLDKLRDHPTPTESNLQHFWALVVNETFINVSKRL
jgi:hypothetical protein